MILFRNHTSASHIYTIFAQYATLPRHTITVSQSHTAPSAPHSQTQIYTILTHLLKTPVEYDNASVPIIYSIALRAYTLIPWHTPTPHTNTPLPHTNTQMLQLYVTRPGHIPRWNSQTRYIINMF